MIDVRSTVVSVGLFAVAALSLTACTVGQDSSPPPSSGAPTSTGTPGPPATVPPPTAPTAPTRSITLRCADAGYADEPGGDPTVAGLTFESIIPGPQNMSSDPYPVSLATELGLIVPPGSTQRFKKLPAYIKAGSGPFTIELNKLEAGQALSWVPAQDWTGGTPPDLRPWMTDQVTLTGCADSDTVYFGGVLAQTLDSCLILHITPPNGPAQDKRVRLGGAPC